MRRGIQKKCARLGTLDRVWLTCVLMLGMAVACPRARAQELAEGVLVRVKAATGLVSAPTSQGSAFLIDRKGTRGVFVTNAHVVDPMRRGGRIDVTVSLRKADGQVARIVGRVSGLSGDDDLAFIEVDSESLPMPLVLTEGVLRETMGVFAIGFPFGGALGVEGSMPSVNVSRAGISSLERDDGDGAVVLIRLDGEINPGNSGGPVVTINGDVIGVAVAKIAGTNISFAVPTATVNRLTKGVVGRASFASPKAGKGDAEALDVRVPVLDPLERLRYVGIVVSIRSTPPPQEVQDGNKRLSEGASHPLKIKDGMATGSIRLRALKPGETMYSQVEYSRAGAERMYTPVRIVSKEADREPAPAPATVLPTPAPKPFPPSLPPDALAPRGPDSPATPSKPVLREVLGPIAGGEPRDEPKTIEFPERIENVVVAGGGKWLVVRLARKPSIAVVDVAQAEVVRTIRVPDSEYMLAAGGGVALVYLPGPALLQSWDLEAGTRNKSLALPVGVSIQSMVMGSRLETVAVCRHTGPQAHGVRLINTTTLEFVVPTDGAYWGDTNQPLCGANADLSAIGTGSNDCSTLLAQVLRRTGTSVSVSQDSNRSECWLTPSDCGYVYGRKGKVYSKGVQPIGSLPSPAPFPGVGSSLVLGIDDQGGATVYAGTHPKPIGRWRVLDEIKATINPKNNTLPHNIPWGVTFLPEMGAVVVVSRTQRALTVYPFDLNAVLAGSGEDYVFIRPTPPDTLQVGKVWTHTLSAMTNSSDVVFALEYGPEGMTLKGDRLSWTPLEAGDDFRVVVTATAKSGMQTYETLLLDVPGKRASR